jgi:hypothetical protein
MTKLALASASAVGVLLLYEVAKGWYDLASVSALVTAGFGLLIWKIVSLRG